MKSAAKSKAARENGKLGGRPKKHKRSARRSNTVLYNTTATRKQ
jgi:hypothetical protein